jgi:3-hydroxyacyl-CoA dehydrogenase
MAITIIFFAGAGLIGAGIAQVFLVHVFLNMITYNLLFHRGDAKHAKNQFFFAFR